MDATDTDVLVSMAESEDMDALAEFSEREWANANKIHYGRDIDFQNKRTYTLVAKKGGRIVGKLVMKYKAGVVEIGEIIVAASHLRRGIGTQMVLKAEAICVHFLAHKIWLETGDTWPETGFYEKLGYRRETLLPRHYSGQTFALYVKYAEKNQRPDYL